MAEKVYTVLLIDDEQGLLVGLSAVMKRAGYLVLTAVNGREGEKMAKEQHPDIIVCDVMMPPPNGNELRRILSLDPTTASIPFIFLTARTGESDMLHGFKLGGDDYITKPFSRDEFVARVGAVLRRYEIAKVQSSSEMEVKIDELKKEISYNFSKEFRTPIGVIVKTLEMILNDNFKGDDVQQRMFVESALKNAEHLQFLIDDVITLADVDMERKKVLRQAVSLELDFRIPISKCLTRWQDRRLVVNLVVDPDVVIYAPKLGFGRVITHLVDNACKFSPKGGELDIKLISKDVGGCTFIVRDEGPGIPVDLREKVFERYFQIQSEKAEDSGGLGVGLTIARAFARSLEGDVSILDSNKGCRVQMVIPPAPLDENSST